MKSAGVVLACMVAGFAIVPAHGRQTASAFASPGESMDMIAEASPSESWDSKQYAAGNKAIHDGKWADAVKIFDEVAQQSGEHAAASLYWKAYAQNKMGQPAQALDSCLALRMQFVKSGWVEDCGALEIEIRASKGQPVPAQPGQSDELKLLALATQMQKDPVAARAQIEQLVQSDSSEHLKEAALFLLGESVPDLRYAQIVRISRLDGDVRIARASTNEKSRHEEWEKAEMNLPLATGDNLVTGADGRAEIEFENSSALYLAPNSVLAFDDLHTTSGVPHTEVELLSGTATIHLDTLMPGEAFLLRTPTNDVMTRYPKQADMRVTSYTDGISVVGLKSGMLNVPGGGKELMIPGQGLFFNKEHALVPMPEKAGDLAEFDAWVADRHEARTEATTEEMKEAGLTAPVPGIADMKGQGRFYPCEPYGTCWEPNEGSGNSVLAQGPAQAPAPKSAGSAPANPASRPADFFPCYPGVTRRSVVQTATFNPWDWVVCHSGWWVHRNGRYVWVSGHKMHHHPPIHWVRFGKTVAIVPLHPKDVKGQPPVNREHGFAPTKEKGGGYAMNPIKLETTHPVELMASAPKEFRNEAMPVLQHMSAPHMEMHAVRDSTTARAGTTPTAGVPLRFDHQTGSFSAPHQVAMGGGHSTTVFAPVGHTGGSYSGHSGGGSFGGGSHGGGGSVGGGGGGSHGGGTTSVSSGGGTISVSGSSGASSASAGGGGSHH